MISTCIDLNLCGTLVTLTTDLNILFFKGHLAEVIFLSNFDAIVAKN